jgi:hypothetical protein
VLAGLVALADELLPRTADPVWDLPPWLSLGVGAGAVVLGALLYLWGRRRG